MFLFIIPRTPIIYRNPLRDLLWEISKKSLLDQSSKNWKAIVVGDTTGEELDSDFFITLNFDNHPKLEKIKLALDHIESNFSKKPEYVIRFDDDDIFSDSALKYIANFPEKFDCYFDEYHTCIDVVYSKISYRKNPWIPNTAIHKYEHAIKSCGPDNIILLMQDHSAFWHTYYSSKKTFKLPKSQPLYYRLLTPFSITSHNSSTEGSIDWTKHLHYLKGYGPWISLPQNFKFFDQLNTIKEKFFSSAPKISNSYWMFHQLKHFKNMIFKS